jgi:hypothetical protein
MLTECEEFDKLTFGPSERVEERDENPAVPIDERTRRQRMAERSGEKTMAAHSGLP